MLAVSTVWCAEREGGVAAALWRLRGLGFEAAELDLPPGVEGVVEVPAVAREIGIRIAGADLRPAEDEEGPGLADPDERRRERAVRAVLDRAAAAKLAGTAKVTIRAGRVAVPAAAERWEDWSRRALLGGVGDEIRKESAALLEERARGRDRHLDAACRALHRLSREDPETEWRIVGAGRLDELPLPDEIEHLVAELPRGRPAYVHDVAAAAVLQGLGAASATEWLRVADRWLAALRLSDAFGLETGLPPGAGAVDWTAVRDATIAGLPRVLRVSRPVEAGELIEGVRFLERAGVV